MADWLTGPMSDRRLPMPGEKPSTIWQPPRKKSRPQWLRAHPGRFLLPLLPHLRWLVVIVILAVGLWGWRSTATHVTVVVNGQVMPISTHRGTVAGAVELAGVRMSETMYVEPPADTSLSEGMVITVGRQHPVIVHADGQVIVVNTHEIDPRSVAIQAGVALSPEDAVVVVRSLRPNPIEIAQNPALADAPIVPREIRVVHPQRIIVHEIQALTGAQIDVSFITTETTLGRALSAAGYAIYEADRVAPALSTSIHRPLDVTIERATPITLSADGLVREVRTRQRTVGDLLAETGLALGGLDYSAPAPDAVLSPGMAVQIVRVHVENASEEFPIPFETVYVPDPDLELDQQRLVEEGEPGILERQRRIRSENGLVVSEAVTGEWVARQPRARVIAYGTRIVIRTIETPYGPLEYWRRLHVLATSYSPSTAGDKQPGDPFFG